MLYTQNTEGGKLPDEHDFNNNGIMFFLKETGYQMVSIKKQSDGIF